MSIILSDISYHYPNTNFVFEHISLSVAAGEKVSIIGHNGAGKSTLLKLLAGFLMPSCGSIQSASKPYYIPQQLDFQGQCISEALGVAEKIEALHSIYSGSTDQRAYDKLADDWDIESRCRLALNFWGLTNVDLQSRIDELSGGEKTKIHLAGLLIHAPDIILLDEPTNHLDESSREKFYDFIINSKATIIVVSHDITLLNLLNTVYELSERGIKRYGGNYSFYEEQHEMERQALTRQIDSEEKMLHLAQLRARKSRERQDKKATRGGKLVSGIPRIVLNGRQAKGENTGAKLSEKHSEIIGKSKQKLYDLKQRQQKEHILKIDIKDAQLHKNKILITTVDVNAAYKEYSPIWQQPLNIEIRSGERIQIAGNNGTGKTSLAKLLIGELSPTEGTIKRADFSSIYLEQEYSQVNKDTTILELAHKYNEGNLPDHEVKLKLNRALFPKSTWDRNCRTLSGGERMRFYFCCLMISNNIPDVMVLDEPTNNLDLSSLSILTDTIKNYRGTLIVISHDKYFIEEIGITRVIKLNDRTEVNK